MFVYIVASLFILAQPSHSTAKFVQIFFNPEIYNNDFTTPLQVVIDKGIQSSPIDTRRALYKVCRIRMFFLLSYFRDFMSFHIVTEYCLVWGFDYV
jgi:hypothetical protein